MPAPLHSGVRPGEDVEAKLMRIVSEAMDGQCDLDTTTRSLRQELERLLAEGA